MPHGGGHIGGGGGGGFHGGGGGGFHVGGGYHHHHHNIFVGPPVVWWGYGWRSPYYWETRAWSRVVVTLAIAFVIIVIVGVVATRFDNNYVSPSYLSPGDTRIVGPSSTLCESTTLNNPTSTVSATVYLLQKKPDLSARNNFTVTDEFTMNYEDYQYKSFYLYPGSTYTLSSCLVSGSVKYYIIKGKSNFDSWVSSPYNSNYNYQLYSNKCGGSNKTDGQTFNSEDEYYFVYYNILYAPVDVAVTLTFYRTEYMPQTGGVVDSCTAPPTSSCSVTIPYNSNYWFLVETTHPSDGQWDTNINVGTSCNARVWVYVVIVFAPLIGVVVIVASIIAVCCCIKRVSGYKRLPTTTEQSPPSVPSAPKQYDQPPQYVASSAPPPYQ